MAYFLCSTRCFVVLFLISAVPLAVLISLETATPSTHVYHYHSNGWARECAKWDDLNRRFLVSFFENGIGQIAVPDHHSPADILDEVPLVRDADLAGNASLGIFIDRPRNRLMVAIADVFGNRYSAVAAYDMTTWNRLFLTQLNAPDEKSLADDVAVDAEGNAYITDAWESKIWKVGVNGEFISTITCPLFTHKGWHRNLVGLNGIVFHPDGYLLVVHMITGHLFKITTGNENEVKPIKLVGGPCSLGDGIELFSPTKLVVAGNPTRLVESTDEWETGTVVGKFRGSKVHRLTTAATVKDGKVYLNHMFGMGFPKKKHAIVEAVFSS
ncbi:uncharacterized protein LOC130751597 [Actinidia eriantha]|uniref:uncharacterized protein LOC130751597 n=1 Tax=Actinidia eriantha TaxID=165200 RepID=UPI00258C5C86|nr:uncharacterized protein LOC130751597 [Actinidia eriantha]